MFQIFWLFFDQNVDLFYQLWRSWLRKVICLILSNSLVPFIFDLIECYDSVESTVPWRLEEFFEFLIERSSLVLIRSHSAFSLIFTLFFPIELLNSHQIENICNKGTLNFQIKRAITC